MRSSRKQPQPAAPRRTKAKDYGFMYQHGYQDLDGHLWELIYADPNAQGPN